MKKFNTQIYTQTTSKKDPNLIYPVNPCQVRLCIVPPLKKGPHDEIFPCTSVIVIEYILTYIFLFIYLCVVCAFYFFILETKCKDAAAPICATV